MSLMFLITLVIPLLLFSMMLPLMSLLFNQLIPLMVLLINHSMTLLFMISKVVPPSSPLLSMMPFLLTNQLLSLMFMIPLVIPLFLSNMMSLLLSIHPITSFGDPKQPISPSIDGLANQSVAVAVVYDTSSGPSEQSPLQPDAPPITTSTSSKDSILSSPSSSSKSIPASNLASKTPPCGRKPRAKSFEKPKYTTSPNSSVAILMQNGRSSYRSFCMQPCNSGANNWATTHRQLMSTFKICDA